MNKFPNKIDGREISATGIAWYTRETYDACMAVMDDRDQLHDTYDDWRRAVEHAAGQLHAQGQHVVQAFIDPAEFPQWAKANGFAHVDGAARQIFASVVARDWVVAQEQAKRETEKRASKHKSPPEAE